MGQQAWRAYAEMALGMTDASRKKATKAVKGLLGRGGATAEQLQGLAEDLRQTSAANREALTRLIRLELDRALGRVGLATADEVADLTARVRELEDQLSQARAPVPAAAGGAGNGASGSVATKRAEPAAELGDAATAAVPPPPRKVAKKAVRRATGAGAAGMAEPAAAPGGIAKGEAVKKAEPARKTAAKKAPAKRAPAEQAAAVPARATARKTTRARTAGTGTPNAVARKAPTKRAAGQGGQP